MCLSVSALAAERVIVLAPAAADVLARLDAGGSVVGVTNSVSEFPGAAKVGTHLHPGVEKIASLKPDLIIANSRFNPELAERMGAELFVYEPRTLDEIIKNVRLLAGRLGRDEQGEALAAELQAVLDGLTMPQNPPTALYETRSTPVAVAKRNSVIKDLLERAGMKYVYEGTAGVVSVEYLLVNQPEYYIYQDGPMNRNPEPPRERRGWHRLKSCVWKVDEFDFARPNTRLFETVRTLNDVLNSNDPCARGAEIYK